VRPGGIRYSTVRVDDTTFVHTVIFDSDASPLDELRSFQAFLSGITHRRAEPPAPVAGRLVGGYPEQASRWPTA
jgi:hypothetical protein